MATVTETPVETAWAHCTSPRCAGNSQEQVKAVQRTTAHTYRERGGDMPGIESSWDVLTFADEGEAKCPHCGTVREIHLQRRKTYAALSGHDPMGLLGAPKFNAAKQAEVRQELAEKGIDPERQALEQQNEALMEQIAKLEAEKDPDAVG